MPPVDPAKKNLFTREKSINNVHHRMILKSGICNVNQPSSKPRHVINFTYSKLVDSSWTFTLLFFLAVLFLSWTCFAASYWLICFAHGDFEPNHLPELQEANRFKPCIYDMRGFSSAFLFSMEAQHTLGYGIKAPTDQCAEAIFVNALHCIIGFVMQGFMAAVIFSKMTKPRIRSRTLVFSKNAVIAPQNGKLCLMFRVGDIRPRYIMDAKMRAFVIKPVKTEEEEILPYPQHEIKIFMDGCTENVFFNWPVILCHVLDHESPLYYLSPSDLCQPKFEIILIIEGTDENNSQVTQAKSSYMPNEILWGYKFQNLLKFDQLRAEYEVDFSKFDSVEPVNTPLCSPIYNEEYVKMQEKTTTLVNINFTPQHTLGAIPVNQLTRLRQDME